MPDSKNWRPLSCTIVTAVVAILKCIPVLRSSAYNVTLKGQRSQIKVQQFIAKLVHSKKSFHGFTIGCVFVVMFVWI